VQPTGNAATAIFATGSDYLSTARMPLTRQPGIGRFLTKNATGERGAESDMPLMERIRE